MELFYKAINEDPLGIIQGRFRTNLIAEAFTKERGDEKYEIIFEKDGQILGLLKTLDIFDVLCDAGEENGYMVIQLEIPEENTDAVIEVVMQYEDYVYSKSGTFKAIDERFSRVKNKISK